MTDTRNSRRDILRNNDEMLSQIQHDLIAETIGKLAKSDLDKATQYAIVKCLCIFAEDVRERMHETHQKMITEREETT